MSSPTLTASPASLNGANGLTYTEGSGPSSARSLMITGTNLSTASSVTVTSSNDFPIATSVSGPYATSVALAATASLSQELFVQLRAGLTPGSYSASLTASGGGASPISVPLSGTVASLATLTANPTAVSNFTASEGTPSAAQSYTLTASLLTDPINVSAPAGVAVGLSAAGPFGSSLNLPASVSRAEVFSRLTAAAAGAVNGTITHVSGSLTANVGISGTISATGTAGAGGTVVISQIYGGGGNTGATFRNDFIELFNRSNSPVDLTGWSVQYAPTAGSNWQVTPLSGTIPAGGYYLVQEAPASLTGTTGGLLSGTDASGSINLAAANGKVALVSSTAALSGSCATGASVIDFVGYGTANCFEGTAGAAAPSNSTAALRNDNGCTDTNNNAADFTVGTPSPRNSTTPVNICNPTGPFIRATPSPVLSYIEGSGPASRTVTVSAGNLTPASGVITVSSSSTAVKLSYNGSAFGSSVTIPYGNPALSSTTLTAQLTAGLAPGSYPATLSLSGGGASLNLNVSGTVSASASAGISPIATARTQTGQTVTIQGRVTASTQISARLFYLQDATGGVAVYSGASPAPDYSAQVQLGDLVTVTGPMVVFNGFVEMSGITSFSIDAGAGRTVPAPQLITLNQLSSYQGQLVRVEDATISGSETSFSGNTNYTLSAGGQSGILRITANSELPGAGKPSTPTSITGIAERFVSQATTIGTDNIQLQPRLLADVQGATAPADQICGGTSTTLTADQTFDVTTWNVEFFGADGGTVNCPTAPTSRPYDDQGPFDEARQARNVKAVIERLNSDVFVVEEVSDATLLSQVVSTSLGGYTLDCSDRFSYYWQDDCDQTEVFLPNRLAQKVCIIYKNSTVVPVPAETKPLLGDLYGYGANGPASGATNNWASGRLPYLFVADVTTNGVTKRVHIVGLHAKSGSAVDDYNRRQQDYIDLKNKLQTDYPKANVLILGDYNDQTIGSITSGRVSSFNTFISDPTNFSVLTQPLEAQGCRTFESGSFLDHITISDELFPAYIPNSINVLTPAVGIEGGYSSNTTSDHRPVTARFDLSLLASPVTATLVASTSVCAGQPASFSVAVGGLSSSETYSYTISNGTNSTSAAGVSAPAVQTSVVPTVPGAFTLTVVTSTNASTTVASGNVAINALPTNASLTSGTLTCAVRSVTLTASATGGSSYTLTGGAGTQTNSTGSFEVSAAGSYTVLISNASGCTATATATVTSSTAVPSAPALTGLSRTVNTSSTPLSLTPFAEATGSNTLSFSGVNGLLNPPTANISQAGTQSFSVTQTDANGCTSLPTPFTITVQQTATQPASQTVCRNSRVVLTAPATGVRYEWYKNGQSAPFKLIDVNSVQRGTGTSSLTLVSVQTTATYYSKVFAANGSFTWAGPFTVAVNVGCTARQAAAELAEVPLNITMAPNPLTGGQLRAVVRGAAGEPLSVQLLDMQGQVIRQQEWSSAEGSQAVEWDISQRPIGTYLLKAQTPGQLKTLKVVKPD